MRADGVAPRSAMLVVRRRRRGFGLDMPRPPDVRRVERNILAWLEQQIPDALPLRVAAVHEARSSGTDGSGPSSTLVLLLPCRGISILRVEALRDSPGPENLRLAAGCLRRNIPLAVVTSVDEARAALRRWGFEPEER